MTPPPPSKTTKECQKYPFCRKIPIILLLCVIYSIKKKNLKQFKNQRKIKNIKKRLKNLNGSVRHGGGSTNPKPVVGVAEAKIWSEATPSYIYI
jgi:hypothetical protein